MKEAVNLGILFETNPDPSCGSPYYMTGPLHVAFVSNQCKVIGDTDRAFDFETGTCLRNIFHHAIIAAGTKSNRSSLKRALALTSSFFVHMGGPSGSAKLEDRLDMPSAYVT